MNQQLFKAVQLSYLKYLFSATVQSFTFNLREVNKEKCLKCNVYHEEN